MAGQEHVVSRRTYFGVFAALMVLTLATVLASQLALGSAAHVSVALLIATIKAALVILFFMHVYYATPLTKLFVTASMVWLAILFALLLADYLMRLR